MWRGWGYSRQENFPLFLFRGAFASGSYLDSFGQLFYLFSLTKGFIYQNKYCDLFCFGRNIAPFGTMHKAVLFCTEQSCQHRFQKSVFK